MNTTARRRNYFALFALLVTILAAYPATAFAYIGPGAGVGLIGAAVGFLVAVFSAIAIILFWPIRILLRRIRGAKAKAAQSEQTDVAEAGS